MAYTDLILDFETYCEVSLKEAGAEKYTRHPSLKPLCMSFTEFDPVSLTRGSVHRWTFQDEDFTLDLSGFESYWAFNAGFDYRVYQACTERQLLPFKLNSDLTTWKDIQVVLAKFALPQSLEQAAEVLDTPIKKQADGNLIVKRCCTKNSTPPTFQDYAKLFLYCDQDIEASFEVLKACPSILISEEEWLLWRITYYMNHNGLPIDYPAVEAIKQRVDAYKDVICESLPELTNNAITKPTQTQRIKAFLHANGVKVPNTTAETLEDIISQDDVAIEKNTVEFEKSNPGVPVPNDIMGLLPTNCRLLIEARMAGGSSSVAKFNKLLEMRVGNKVHDFIRYGGTSTIRWAGAGYQVHSLPKASVNDPDELIDRFINFGDIKNPIKSAKALCRSVIKAPDGRLIYAGDFSSIEYMLLIWITDMIEKLDFFREGKSAYIDMAAYLFSKPYEAIDKHATDNLEYFLGKQAILGCGYQMGAKKFQATCAKYGVEIPISEAKFAVTGYRKMYKPIADMWDNVLKCSIAAVQNPNVVFKTCKCEFRTAKDRTGTNWLIISLPSGTKQFYHTPTLAMGKFGYELRHMGLADYKWTRKFLSPGRITENIIQRLARELMGHSIIEINKLSDKFQILFQVHDELVSLGPADDSEENLKLYLDTLALTPDWGKTIPLRAGGYTGNRYKKD